MWPLREADEPAVALLAAESRLSPTLARLLWLRGVRTAQDVRRWFAPTVADLHPPELLPDFEPAVARIKQAIAGKQRILLWGHDDLDGVTGIVVLHRLLTDLHAQVRYYIPEKGREPHGLNPELVAGQGADAVGLVITVDCGITNRQQVEELHSRGIDVIVTDHHEVTEEMPRAVANVDPKRPDSAYPYRGLAGAGVALKLGMGLARSLLGLSTAEFLSVQPQLLAITVLGTIADRVPLTGENRTLVMLGLRHLENSTVPAVRAVVDYLHCSTGAAAANRDEKLTVLRCTTGLLPMFAAARGNDGVRRFLTANPDEARAWVLELEQRAHDWRAEAELSYDLAEKTAMVGDGIVFVRGKELSLRALGFCAARLKERYQLPAIVIGWRGDAWVGEGRGMEGASLMELLAAHSQWFIDYGGHRKAAGFSILDDRVPGFISSAEKYAHGHFAGRAQPENVVVADAHLPLSEFDPELVKLAPFGEGNPQPLLVSEPVTLEPRGDDWVASTRQDLVLRPRARLSVEPGLQMRLLYTLDDIGRLFIVDAETTHCPTGAAAANDQR